MRARSNDSSGLPAQAGRGSPKKKSQPDGVAAESRTRSSVYTRALLQSTSRPNSSSARMNPPPVYMSTLLPKASIDSIPVTVLNV